VQAHRSDYARETNAYDVDKCVRTAVLRLLRTVLLAVTRSELLGEPALARNQTKFTWVEGTER
jgi:hypothetical protein